VLKKEVLGSLVMLGILIRKNRTWPQLSPARKRIVVEGHVYTVGNKRRDIGKAKDSQKLLWAGPRKGRKLTPALEHRA